MPAGGFSVSAPSGVEFEAKITPIVVISCIMAATGGLMFGYDVGISGTPPASFISSIFSIPTYMHVFVLYLSCVGSENHATSSMERRSA